MYQCDSDGAFSHYHDIPGTPVYLHMHARSRKEIPCVSLLILLLQSKGASSPPNYINDPTPSLRYWTTDNQLNKPLALDARPYQHRAETRRHGH